MVQPRENRVPIMMSEEELSAIDDWRFANRVATRSEAIRRLAASGLVLSKSANELFGNIVDAVDDIDTTNQEIEAFLTRLPDGDISREQAIEIAYYYSTLVQKDQDTIWAIMEQTRDILGSAIESAYKVRVRDVFSVRAVHEATKRLMAKILGQSPPRGK